MRRQCSSTRPRKTAVCENRARRTRSSTRSRAAVPRGDRARHPHTRGETDMHDGAVPLSPDNERRLRRVLPCGNLRARARRGGRAAHGRGAQPDEAADRGGEHAHGIPPASRSRTTSGRAAGRTDSCVKGSWRGLTLLGLGWPGGQNGELRTTTTRRSGQASELCTISLSQVTPRARFWASRRLAYDPRLRAGWRCGKTMQLYLSPESQTRR